MVRPSFLERNLASFFAILERAVAAEEFAQRKGLLQRLDPRVKLAGFLALVIATIAARALWVITIIFVVVTALALFSKISARALAFRAWLPVLFFTGLIALPAIFFTPGAIAMRGPIDITWPGLRAAAFLMSRAETAATCVLVLVLSTRWTQLLQALRVFRLPRMIVLIIGMTQRYIFLLLRSAHDLFEARRSRMVGRLDGSQRRRLAAANTGVLMSRSLDLSAEVYAAMQSRGFRGEIYTFQQMAMQKRDWIALTFFLAAAVTLIWAG